MELHLAGASTMDEANRVLEDFLPRFNARFSVPASQSGSAYRRPPQDLGLTGVLCFKYQLTVAGDNTIRFAGRTLQLLPGLERPSYTHARMEIQERLDGSLVVCYQGQTIAPPLRHRTIRLSCVPARRPGLGPPQCLRAPYQFR